MVSFILTKIRGFAAVAIDCILPSVLTWVISCAPEISEMKTLFSSTL